MRETRPTLLRRTQAIAATATAVLVAALLLPAAGLAAGAATTALGQETPTTTSGESTPLDLGSGAAQVQTGGSSGIMRAIVALVLVVALIYGVRWALRRTQGHRIGRAAGDGMRPLASLPLGARGTLHLVRVGDDVMLLGQADGQLTALRTYERDEAERLGMLVELDEEDEDGDEPRWNGPGGQTASIGGYLRDAVETLRQRSVRR